MKKKFDLGYLLPILVGIGTILTGINEKKNSDRNEELEKKLDLLNERLEKEEA